MAYWAWFYPQNQKIPRAFISRYLEITGLTIKNFPIAGVEIWKIFKSIAAIKKIQFNLNLQDIQDKTRQ